MVQTTPVDLVPDGCPTSPRKCLSTGPFKTGFWTVSHGMPHDLSGVRRVTFDHHSFHINLVRRRHSVQQHQVDHSTARGCLQVLCLLPSPDLRYLDLQTPESRSHPGDLALRTTAPTPYLSQSKTSRVFQPHHNPFRFSPRIPIQSPTLSESAISRDNGGGSTVPLRHLKRLSLARTFDLVFQLLRRPDHSKMAWLCSIGR